MQGQALYELTGVYLDAYNAIVRPNSIFPVPIYVLRRWTETLGATGFWLLVTLQQLVFRQKDDQPAGWCKINRANLAREANVGEGTIHRYLHGDEYTSTGLRHWVTPQTSRKQVHSRRQPVARYKVISDTPLAPVDQRGLAQYLQESVGDDPDQALGKVSCALEDLAGKKLEKLLALLDECASRFTPPSKWKDDKFYPTVASVAGTLGLEIREQDKTEFGRSCSNVQVALTDLTWLGKQYFLKTLLPELGHKRALVVAQCRSRCFKNDYEKRDLLTVSPLELARLSDCAPNWLRDALFGSNSLSDPHPPDPQLSQFIEVVEKGRGRSCPTFRINLTEPIAPQDLARYEMLLKGSLSETGQMMLAGLDDASAEKPNQDSGEHLRDLDSSGGHLTSDLDSSGGHLSDLGSSGGHLTSDLDSSGGHLSDLDSPGGRVDSSGGQVLSTLNTTPRITLQQQQHADGEDAAAVAGGLLETFGIVQPFKGRILRTNVDVVVIRAWMLYAVTQSGFTEDNGVQKYVAKRLLSLEAPPERFVRWAKLTPADWRALWRATLGDRAGLSGDLAQLLTEWAEHFGDMFPQGPFGDEDAHAIMQQVREQQAELARLSRETMRPTEPAPQPATLSAEEAMARGLAIPMGEGKWIGVEQVWQAALGELQLQLTGATYNTWLGRTVALGYRDGTLLIGVHNGYAKDWLENRLASMVKRTVAGIVGQNIEVRFVVVAHTDAERPEVWPQRRAA